MSAVRGPHILAPAVLALTLLLPVAARGEETVLIFEQATRTMTRRPAAEGGTRMDSTKAEIIVVLGDHRVTVYDSDQLRIYDFARNRLIQADPAARTFGNWSLYSYVAFNDVELASRLGQRDPRTGETHAGTSVLELEATFSMRATDVRPHSRESVVDSSHGDRVRVLLNGRVSTFSVPSRTTLSPARAAMFARFLLYRCHIHPVAQRALARVGSVPETLFFRFRDFNEETIVLLSLKRASTVPEEGNPLRGFTQVDASGPDFEALAARLAEFRSGCADSSRAPWVEASRRFESEALAAGRYLDAALASMERAMVTCEQPSTESWPAEALRSGQADPQVAACMSMGAWKNKEAAAEGLRTLQAIDRTQLRDGRVLDLAVARTRLSTGDLEGGAGMLVAALAQNPCAVEAWMDLGGAYVNTSQMVVAWLCFDAVRRVAPAECRAVTVCNEYESQLRRKHPEYFE